MVRAEFYRAVVFQEASQRAGALTLSTSPRNCRAEAVPGRTVDKEVVMLDVGGLSLGLLKVMPLFKVVNAIGSSYFPERTINILVLNAPRVFQQLWAIVRAPTPRAAAWRTPSRAPRPFTQLQKLVDPRTQKKVHILSGGEHQLTGARRACSHACSRGAVVTGARAAPRAQCCARFWRMRTSQSRWAGSVRRLS